VVDGKLRVPAGPGLGITMNEEAVRANLLPGEPYWD
jgi:L-alanine-DL-glutamate epimerase-like enolase superfamily enzyme